MGSKTSAGGRLAPAPHSEFEQKVRELSARGWGTNLGFRQIAGDPIDSADAVPADWLRVRDVLEAEWRHFDGFVVVYGTDTMSYAAAFLSFAIEFQDKPVVVTGSMKPIFEPGDATANLKASVQVASSKAVDGSAIDQVLICFGGRILRGNRATKVGSDYLAISTPRVYDLGSYKTSGARWGIPEWGDGHPKRVVSRDREKETSFQRIRESRVALVRMFPGITSEMVRAMLQGVEGVVIEGYGSGTGPRAVRECLVELANRGQHIVVTTEVIWGKVEVGAYATDLVTAGSPLIPGGKLLAEAALAKLYYLLGIANRGVPDWSKWVKETMQKSIRGDNGDF